MQNILIVEGDGKKGEGERLLLVQPSTISRPAPQEFARGYCECDMVEHCGGVKEGGNFVHTLTLTDIHSGWTECAALAIREQNLVVEGNSAIAQHLPFALRSLDTDNDTAFMSGTLQGYCEQCHIEWTRSRAYHKNDQAWVEQKNGALGRRLAGYGRLSGLAAAGALQRLYESARLYVNFFQPSLKLASKQRNAALVRKRYHPPLTPYQRLLASDAVDEMVKQRLHDQSRFYRFEYRTAAPSADEKRYFVVALRTDENKTAWCRTAADPGRPYRGIAGRRSLPQGSGAGACLAAFQ